MYLVHTSLAFCVSPPEDTRTRRTLTFEPLYVPLYAHPIRDSESVHDVGSTSLMPHTVLSSCKNSWKAGLLRSETPNRTYTNVNGSASKDESETHTIQILDEPRQILASKIW